LPKLGTVRAGAALSARHIDYCCIKINTVP
jgi:hypothetical protein